MKTLNDWLSHLETAHSAGLIDMGLSRVGEVKAAMNLNPQCPVIVVAGTNGKGSVCAFLTQIYKQAGFKVGTLTSPHLLTFNERIAVNAEPVSDETIVASFERIEAARGGISLTYFEFNTLAAVDIFMREHVDVMVLEVGLGEPVFDRLDADIAHAMMSINAVKGVEIGAGFGCISQRGSEHGDELTPKGFLSNHAGGILGGISTGQDIAVNIAVKPTSSIATPRRSIDIEGNPVELATHGRHDPCVGLRAAPIAEAMLALVLIDHALRHRAQNAGVRVDTPDIARR